MKVKVKNDRPKVVKKIWSRYRDSPWENSTAISKNIRQDRIIFPKYHFARLSVYVQHPLK